MKAGDGTAIRAVINLTDPVAEATGVASIQRDYRTPTMTVAELTADFIEKCEQSLGVIITASDIESLTFTHTLVDMEVK